MHADPSLTTHVGLGQRDAHRRQVGLVRTSLILRPPVGRPTHRRWA
jgi:hypothetical protein